MNTDPLVQNPQSFGADFSPDEIKRELARNMVQQMGRDPSFATEALVSSRRASEPTRSGREWEA